MQLDLYFAEQKTRLLHANKCLSKSRGIQRFFLKLINIYIVTEPLVFIVLQLSTQEKVKLEKISETVSRKCSADRCSAKLTKIHRKVPVLESHLNVVAGLHPTTLLRNRSRDKCFRVITIHTFKLSGVHKFLMIF